MYSFYFRFGTAHEIILLLLAFHVLLPLVFPVPIVLLLHILQLCLKLVDFLIGDGDLLFQILPLPLHLVNFSLVVLAHIIVLVLEFLLYALLLQFGCHLVLIEFLLQSVELSRDAVQLLFLLFQLFRELANFE